MKRNLIRAAAFAATTLAVSIAFAVDPAQPGPSMQGQGDHMPMHSRMMSEPGGGSMCGGMMGMMGNRGAGGMMMGGGRRMSPGTAALPQLPPGNEKLEFQMHAEMMQKIGEIASRYAERIRQQ